MLNKQFLRTMSQLHTNMTNFFPPAPVHSSHLLEVNQKDFQELRNELVTKAEQKAELYMYPGKSSINPLPVLMSKSQIAQYKSIQEALSFAIEGMVENYYKDERISEAFRFSSQVKEILELYRNIPYEAIGSYR